MAAAQWECVCVAHADVYAALHVVVREPGTKAVISQCIWLINGRVRVYVTTGETEEDDITRASCTAGLLLASGMRFRKLMATLRMPCCAISRAGVTHSMSIR